MEVAYKAELVGKLAGFGKAGATRLRPWHERAAVPTHNLGLCRSCSHSFHS